MPPPGRAHTCPRTGRFHPARPRPQIVVDMSSFVAQLPHSIAGVFFTSDRERSSRIRQQFMRHYRLSEEDGPVLLHLDLNDPDRPFSLAS